MCSFIKGQLIDGLSVFMKNPIFPDIVMEVYNSHETTLIICFVLNVH